MRAKGGRLQCAESEVTEVGALLGRALSVAVGWEPWSSAGRRTSKGCQILDFWKEGRQLKRRGSEFHFARCPLVQGSHRLEAQRPGGAWLRLWKEGVRFRLKRGFLGSRIDPQAKLIRSRGSLDQIVGGKSEIQIGRGIFWVRGSTHRRSS